MVLNEWQYWNESGCDEELIEDRKVAAFVYKIEFSDGSFYVGQKRLFKGIKDAKKINSKSVESNWREYQSSSTEVKSRIESGEKFTKTILAVFPTYAEAIHCETSLISLLCGSELNLNKALIVKTRLSNAVCSTQHMNKVWTLLEELR